MLLGRREEADMAKRYRIALTGEERLKLDALAKKGGGAPRAAVCALALLLSDRGPEGRGPKTSLEISRILNISAKTIESLKNRFAEGGIALALRRRRKAAKPEARKFGGAFEDRLLALASSPPPAGRARWTVRLLAEKLAESGAAPEGVSPMTVHRALRKAKLDLAAGGAARSRRSPAPGS
jgi:transposase